MTSRSTVDLYNFFKLVKFENWMLLKKNLTAELDKLRLDPRDYFGQEKTFTQQKEHLFSHRREIMASWSASLLHISRCHDFNPLRYLTSRALETPLMETTTLFPRAMFDSQQRRNTMLGRSNDSTFGDKNTKKSSPSESLEFRPQYKNG